MLLSVYIYYFGIFVVVQKSVFFLYFFRNRIVTNQKPELVIKLSVKLLSKVKPEKDEIYNLILSALMSIKQKAMCPVDTGRKLNVHKTFRRRLDVFWTSYVRSIYVLCLLGRATIFTSVLLFHHMNMNMRKHQLSSLNLRSSHQRCSIKKDVLQNFTKFTRVSFITTLLKKRL